MAGEIVSGERVLTPEQLFDRGARVAIDLSAVHVGNGRMSYRSALKSMPASKRVPRIQRASWLFTVWAVMFLFACAGTHTSSFKLEDLDECIVTTSDRAADEHKSKSKVVAESKYVRSRLLAEQIRILKVDPDGGLKVLSSAVDDIRPGDTVTQVYGIETNSFAKLFDLLELNVGRQARFTIRRNDSTTHAVAPNEPCKYYSSGRVERVLYDELYSGTPVNLLVLPTIVKLQGSGRAQQLEPALKRLADDPRMSDALYGIVGFEKFKIIENRNLDVLLKELELTQLGLIDQNTSVKVGQMTGANFVAETTFLYYIRGDRIESQDTIKKLYSLESGTVVGVDTVTVSPR